MVTITVTNVGLDNAYDADDSGAIDKQRGHTGNATTTSLRDGITAAINKCRMLLALINLYLFG